MPRGKRPLTIQVTHGYVEDPEAVDRALKIWASMLGEALRRQALAEAEGGAEAAAGAPATPPAGPGPAADTPPGTAAPAGR